MNFNRFNGYEKAKKVDFFFRFKEEKKEKENRNYHQMTRPA